jgi:hypothetical protein
MLPRPGQGAYHLVFVDEYFSALDITKKTCIEKALEKATTKVCKGNEVVEKNNKDAVRLILLKLFITLLFPNVGSTISWNLVKHS